MIDDTRPDPTTRPDPILHRVHETSTDGPLRRQTVRRTHVTTTEPANRGRGGLPARGFVHWPQHPAARATP